MYLLANLQDTITKNLKSFDKLYNFLKTRQGQSRQSPCVGEKAH